MARMSGILGDRPKRRVAAPRASLSCHAKQGKPPGVDGSADAAHLSSLGHSIGVAPDGGWHMPLETLPTPPSGALAQAPVVRHNLGQPLAIARIVQSDLEFATHRLVVHPLVTAPIAPADTLL